MLNKWFVSFGRSESGWLTPSFLKLKAMSNINLGNSFNQFKKQIFMSETKSYTEMFDDCFNTGIDAAINLIKNQQAIYKAINPNGTEVGALEATIISLEYLKKSSPILRNKLETQDDLKNVL
jgi:hypothetical protein